MIKWRRLPRRIAFRCYCGHETCARMPTHFAVHNKSKLYRCFKHMKAYDKMAPLHRPDAGSETEETLQASTAALSSTVLQA